MVEANPGDQTGGGKNKEAVHRTPAQAKKRHGPGGNEMHDDAEMEREQGAQAGEKEIQGALRGGDASRKEGEGQHGLSSAPQGSEEGGVEPCSLVLGKDLQSCLQGGATIVAAPHEKERESARETLGQGDTPLGEVVPGGTASLQPQQAKTRAVGAVEILPPMGPAPLQSCLQEAHAGVTHEGMQVEDGTRAHDQDGTPLGEVCHEGTASMQPEGGPMSPPVAMTNLTPLQSCLQDGATEVVAHQGDGVYTHHRKTAGSTDASTTVRPMPQLRSVSTPTAPSTTPRAPAAAAMHSAAAHATQATRDRIATGMRGKDSTASSTDAATTTQMEQQPMSASMGCERDRERMGGDPGTSGTAASSCSVARRAGRVPLRLTASVIGGMEDGVGTMNSVAYVPLPHESETGACGSAQDMESHTKDNTAGSSASRGSVRAKIDIYAKFKLTKMRETNGARDIGRHTQGGATWLTEEAMESEGGGHVMQHGSAWDGGEPAAANSSQRESEGRRGTDIQCTPGKAHGTHSVPACDGGEQSRSGEKVDEPDAHATHCSGPEKEGGSAPCAGAQTAEAGMAMETRRAHVNMHATLTGTCASGEDVDGIVMEGSQGEQRGANKKTGEGGQRGVPENESNEAATDKRPVQPAVTDPICEVPE